MISFKEIFNENDINESTWDSLEKDLIKIIKKYKKYSSNDKSSPAASGYGNSTARAIHKGNLELAKQERTGQSSYSSGTWWPIGIKIGSAFPEDIAKKVKNDVKKLEKKYKNLKADGQPIMFDTSYGSAWGMAGFRPNYKAQSYNHDDWQDN